MPQTDPRGVRVACLIPNRVTLARRMCYTGQARFPKDGNGVNAGRARKCSLASGAGAVSV